MGVSEIDGSEPYVRYRRFPCRECPVRCDNKDNPRSKFPRERWEQLRRTWEGTRPGESAPLGAALFGCHEGAPGSGEDLLCAGWAASFGTGSVTLRLLASAGMVPREVFRPGDNWPELYRNWDTMASAQLWRPGDPDDHLPPELCGR